MTREINLRINGREEKITIDDADTLLEVLRDRFKLWSVREGCGVGACGTCTVLLDNRPVSSCFLLAARARRPGYRDPRRIKRGAGASLHSRGVREPAGVTVCLLHARFRFVG